MQTFHAVRRSKERIDFNEKTSGRFIENAFKRGLSAESFSARERNFIRKRDKKDGCKAVVYNDYCFIFNADGYCVTMYRVPKWFGKTLYDGKQEIKNVKKYMRLNNLFDKEEVRYGLRQVS
jgi:hypothetical protein